MQDSVVGCKKGEVIRERLAESDGTLFEYLNPGEYRIRLYVDDNGDGFGLREIGKVGNSQRQYTTLTVQSVYELIGM